MATRKPRGLLTRQIDAARIRKAERERERLERQVISEMLGKTPRRELPSPFGCAMAMVFCVGCVAVIISAAWGDAGPDYLTAQMRENAGLAEMPAPRPGLDLSAPEEAAGEEVAEVEMDEYARKLARALRIGDVLEEDGDGAMLIVYEIIDRGPHLSDGQVYEIAWAIARYCRQYDIRPALVLSLIAVESGYAIQAASRTNDFGLMQLHARPNLRGVIGPNIQAGVEHLAMWRDAHGGGEREYLAHYNGGPNPPSVSWAYADKVLKGVR